MLTQQFVGRGHPAKDIQCVVFLGAKVSNVGWAVCVLQDSAGQGGHELQGILHVGQEVGGANVHCRVHPALTEGLLKV